MSSEENKVLQSLKGSDDFKNFFTEEQLDKITKYAENGEGDINTVEGVKKMMKDLGIDLNELGKQIKKKTAAPPKKSTRILPNELCLCGSGKKYKKCCRN